MTKEFYDKVQAYRGIIDTFAKCGEYVGGGDGLVSLYEAEYSTKVETRCPGCFGAMLLDFKNKITDYEKANQ